MWNYAGSDKYFQDNCLCFGLHCAPFIFTQLNEFVVRCMSRRGIEGVFGYLDDFLVEGRHADACNLKLHILVWLLRDLGFWINWKKVTPTATSITYFGIEINSLTMEFRLSSRKLFRLVDMVHDGSRKVASERDLQVLEGHLAHASTVVRGGRTFSRHLLDLIKRFPKGSRMVAIPSWVRFDLHWWCRLLAVFNGSSKIIKSDYGLNLETDASMSGFGGIHGFDWFAGCGDVRFESPLGASSYGI